MEEYVKGPNPDRWHWYKECTQYPRAAIEKRTRRPTSDLCDECLEIEAKQLRTLVN
jgi:hypothetical protein